MEREGGKEGQMPCRWGGREGEIGREGQVLNK